MKLNETWKFNMQNMYITMFVINNSIQLTFIIYTMSRIAFPSISAVLFSGLRALKGFLVKQYSSWRAEHLSIQKTLISYSFHDFPEILPLNVAIEAFGGVLSVSLGFSDPSRLPRIVNRDGKHDNRALFGYPNYWAQFFKKHRSPWRKCTMDGVGSQSLKFLFVKFYHEVFSSHNVDGWREAMNTSLFNLYMQHQTLISSERNSVFQDAEPFRFPSNWRWCIIFTVWTICTVSPRPTFSTFDIFSISSWWKWASENFSSKPKPSSHRLVIPRFRSCNPAVVGHTFPSTGVTGFILRPSARFSSS